MPGTKITSHAGNEKAWVWTSVDFADEEQKIEMFAIRFGTIESTPSLPSLILRRTPHREIVGSL